MKACFSFIKTVSTQILINKMNFDFNDAYEDEIEDFKFKFGQKINNQQLNKSYTKTPLFSYDYIDLGITNYHFKQECFDNYDCQKYFEMVNSLSNMTINNLIDESKQSDHFHVYPFPTPKQRQLLTRVLNKPSFRDEELPPIGQFALYTNNANLANRATQVKSARIYFIIGPNAVFYILFYDPYHEINGKK